MLGAGTVVLVYLLARLRALVVSAWIVLLGCAGWLLWFAVTNALGLLLTLAAGVVTVLALALVTRRVRRHRLHRALLDDWID